MAAAGAAAGAGAGAAAGLGSGVVLVAACKCEVVADIVGGTVADKDSIVDKFVVDKAHIQHIADNTADTVADTTALK